MTHRHVALHGEDDDDPDGDVSGHVADGPPVRVEGVGGVAQPAPSAADEGQREAEDQVDDVGEGQGQQVDVGGCPHRGLHQHEDVEQVAEESNRDHDRRDDGLNHKAS